MSWLTVGIKIHKHHKKADGTYNVKIRVAHKGEKKHINTPHFVVDKQTGICMIIKDKLCPEKVPTSLLKGQRLILMNSNHIRGSI